MLNVNYVNFSYVSMVVFLYFILYVTVPVFAFLLYLVITLTQRQNIM